MPQASRSGYHASGLLPRLEANERYLATRPTSREAGKSTWLLQDVAVSNLLTRGTSDRPTPCCCGRSRRPAWQQALRATDRRRLTPATLVACGTRRRGPSRHASRLSLAPPTPRRPAATTVSPARAACTGLLNAVVWITCAPHWRTCSSRKSPAPVQAGRQEWETRRGGGHRSAATAPRPRTRSG